MEQFALGDVVKMRKDKMVKYLLNEFIYLYEQFAGRSIILVKRKDLEMYEVLGIDTNELVKTDNKSYSKKEIDTIKVISNLRFDYTPTEEYHCSFTMKKNNEVAILMHALTDLYAYDSVDTELIKQLCIKYLESVHSKLYRFYFIEPRLS